MQNEYLYNKLKWKEYKLKEIEEVISFFSSCLSTLTVLGGCLMSICISFMFIIYFLQVKFYEKENLVGGWDKKKKRIIKISG